MSNFVKRFQWRYSLSDSEPGYRVQGSNDHWIWLSRADAWDAANELADLLSEDLAKVGANND